MKNFLDQDYIWIPIVSIFFILLVIAFLLNYLRNKKQKAEGKISIHEQEKNLAIELKIIAQVFFLIAAIDELKRSNKIIKNKEFLNERIQKVLRLILNSQEVQDLKNDLAKYVAINHKIGKLMNCHCCEWNSKEQKTVSYFHKVYILNAHVTKPILQKFSKEYKRFIFNNEQNNKKFNSTY